VADYVLITCEHGGNRIPAEYRHLFDAQEALLESHRGYDIGALTMAEELAEAFHAPLVVSTVSRLLIDLNRSIGHVRLHFETVRTAPSSLRQRIIEEHYEPYRAKAEHYVQRALAAGQRVVHISSHSFTPELFGKVRSADVGLLYDPARPGEVALSESWRNAYRAQAPQIIVRRNYPYAGKGDGLTRHLRRRYAPDLYVGIELEINQKHVLHAGAQWVNLRRATIQSLRAALTSHHAE
jgi:predicted N-formylglutamate amidohydrolase